MKKKNYFLASLKSLKKGVDPDPLVRGTDPDPHQNVMDPQKLGGRELVG